MTGYITATRVASIQSSLTGEQLRILEHFTHVHVTSGRQLRALTASDSVYERRRLQRHLKHLTDNRVLARLERRIGGVRAGSDGYLYRLDVVGQRITDPRPRRQWRRPWTPSARLLDHDLAVSDLYVELVDADRHGHLDLIAYTTEPGCWRSFAGPGGGRIVLKPDAHLVIGVGDLESHAWIEVDRATESLTWITDKAKTYGRYHQTGIEQAHEGVFPRCLWIAPSTKRANGLKAALARLPPDHQPLHHVTTAAGALHALTGNQPVNEGTPS